MFWEWSCLEENGRYSVRFGRQKINLHPFETDIRPVADHPKPCSMNYCLAAEGDPRRIQRTLVLVSDLEDALVERMFLKPFHSVQAAYDAAEARRGRHGPRHALRRVHAAVGS